MIFWLSRTLCFFNRQVSRCFFPISPKKERKKEKKKKVMILPFLCVHYDLSAFGRKLQFHLTKQHPSKHWYTKKEQRRLEGRGLHSKQNKTGNGIYCQTKFIHLSILFFTSTEICNVLCDICFVYFVCILYIFIYFSRGYCLKWKEGDIGYFPIPGCPCFTNDLPLCG